MTSFDPRLITAMKNGDDAALGQFYRSCTRGFVVGHTTWWPHMDTKMCPGNLYDCTAENPYIQGDAKVTTWLFSITRNVVNNRRRKLAIRRFVGMERIERLADDVALDEHLTANSSGKSFRKP